MFDDVNLPELASIAQSVITPEVVSGARVWHVNDHLRHKLSRAMFARGKPDPGVADASPLEQSSLLSQFSKNVAGPIIELLPPSTAAFAVLMLYEEFVKAVFIEPVLQAEVGGEG